MRCGREFNHLLYDFASNLLDTEAREAVEAHVASCADCRRELGAMRNLSADMQRLEKATRIDFSAAAAAELFDRAGRQLAARPPLAGARLVTNDGLTLLQVARRRQRRRNWSRLLVPLAAAVLLIVGLQLLPLLIDPAKPAAPEPLEQLARLSSRMVAVEEIHGLSPLARKAVDAAISAPNIDADRLANLQLVHYISSKAVEPQQIRDVRFLVDLTRSTNSGIPLAALSAEHGFDLIKVLSGLLEQRAMADVLPADLLGQARESIAAGDYDAAYRLLADSNQPEAQPLAAYAAIHTDRWEAADGLLDAMSEMGRADRRLIDLLQAELALREARYDVAVDCFGRAAGRERNRLWFHAGYLAKYELHDDVLAGQLFQRTEDRQLQAHVQRRFGDVVAMSRDARELFREDFEAHAVGGVPQGWRLIPAHQGEFEIADVDGSRVLLVRESGFPRGRLSFGYPGLSNYTFGCDFKVLKADTDAEIDLTVYDTGLRHYALRLDGPNLHLVHRRLGGHGDGDSAEPAPAASAALEQSTTDGQWWQSRIEVRTLDMQRTQVRAKVWPRDGAMPDQWQMEWTDVAESPQTALQHGKVGLRVAGADIAFDNLVISAIGGALPSPAE